MGSQNQARGSCPTEFYGFYRAAVDGNRGLVEAKAGENIARSEEVRKVIVRSLGVARFLLPEMMDEHCHCRLLKKMKPDFSTIAWTV
ncbi:hypothetical protein ACLOJK_007192 [Asimina triloba]